METSRPKVINIALDYTVIKCFPYILIEFTKPFWIGPFVDHGMMFLQDAVDGLQDAGISTGLVDLLGQDDVQAIMAKAFDPQREPR